MYMMFVVVVEVIVNLMCLGDLVFYFFNLVVYEVVFEVVERVVVVYGEKDGVY